MPQVIQESRRKGLVLPDCERGICSNRPGVGQPPHFSIDRPAISPVCGLQSGYAAQRLLPMLCLARAAALATIESQEIAHHYRRDNGQPDPESRPCGAAAPRTGGEPTPGAEVPDEVADAIIHEPQQALGPRAPAFLNPFIEINLGLDDEQGN